MGYLDVFQSRQAARFAVASIFLASGALMLMNVSEYSKYVHEAFTGFFLLESVDMAGMANLLVIIAASLEVMGGLALVCGGENCGTVMLLLALLPITIVMHPPFTAGPRRPTKHTMTWWRLLVTFAMEPEQALDWVAALRLDMGQMVQFFKNVSIIGGLIAIRASMPGHGHGGERNRDRERERSRRKRGAASTSGKGKAKAAGGGKGSTGTRDGVSAGDGDGDGDVGEADRGAATGHAKGTAKGTLQGSGDGERDGDSDGNGALSGRGRTPVRASDAAYHAAQARAAAPAAGDSDEGEGEGEADE